EHAFVRKRSPDLGHGLGEALIWEPTDERPHAVMVCSHSIQSYARWFEPLGERLATLGVAVWEFNRPGNGLGPQQQRPLHVNHWKEWIEQLRRVARAAQRPGVPTYVIGSSWGARPALRPSPAISAIFAGATFLDPALKTGRDFAFFVQS